MNTEIHQLERDAYFSVLKAFKVQSDAINWGKEYLISELRKELRVSDAEHREFVSVMLSDSYRISTEIHQLERDAYFSVLKVFKVQSKLIPWEKERLISDLRKELRVSDEQHREYLRRIRGEILGRVDAGSRGKMMQSMQSMDQYNDAVLPVQSTKGKVDDIDMVDTKLVIHVVKKALLRSPPNRLEMEHAQKILKNQEASLQYALLCLSDASQELSDAFQDLEDKQQDINRQLALGAETRMITDGEGGGNKLQGSQESSKVEASNDGEDVEIY